MHTPISTAAPEASDYADAFALHTASLTFDVQLDFTAQEAQQRAELLVHLRDMVSQCARGETYLLPFGSYALGIDSPGTDIDALCVCTSAEDLSTLFAGIEQALRADARTSHLVLIPEAIVPTIKLCLRGIDVDLIFAQLARAQLPTIAELETEDVLCGLDLNAVRALNGYRVAQCMRALIPHRDHWCAAVKIIKLWAKRRGLYGNSFGFLGGIGYALLMTLVHQLYPNALTATLVEKFFLVLERWPWPTPVMLNELQKRARGGNLSRVNEMVWTREIGANLMPILTPAFPAMNAAYNVNRSTLALLKAEISRARALLEQSRGSDASERANAWQTLFEGAPFFTRYPIYLELEIKATSAHAYEIWLGFVESRICKLVLGLERALGTVQGQVQPFPRAFHAEDSACAAPAASHSALTTSYFIGIDYQPPKRAGVRISLTPTVADFRKRVNAWDKKTEEMSLRLQLFRVKQGDTLPSHVR